VGSSGSTKSAAVRSYRAALALAVVAFGGYFAATALGDLVPLEHFGADFTTTPTTSTVTRVESSSPAERAGLIAGDEIVAVEGRPVHNALDWASVFARVETARPLPMTVRRNGRIEQLSAVFERRPGRPWETREELFIVLARVAQLVTLLFAIAIGIRATGRPAVFGFWLLATISIYSVGLPPRMAVVWRALPIPLELLFFFPSISKVLIGFILFAFVCTLLNVRLGVRRAVLVGAPFVAFALWDAIFLLALLHVPEWIPRLTGFLPAIILVNLAYVLAALVMLGVHYRTLTDPSERRRLRWILAGSVLGCAAGAPIVAGLWLGVSNDPTLIYHSPIGLQLVYMAFLVMPASFWWAIARGELFDLRFVVRRGLQYVFARRGLLVIMPIVVASLVAEAALHDNEPLRQILRTHAWLYYGAAAALLVFRRRRAAWLDLLDRRLFRERYDAVQLLRDVVAKIRISRDVKTAAEWAATQIDAALHPEWVVACRCQSAGNPVEVLASHGIAADQFERPDRAAGGLVVPATVNAGGVTFMLGAKRSGEPYSQEDKNLVYAVAESIGDLAATRSTDAAADVTRSDNEPAWDTRVWNLADAVARGSCVDWTKESIEIVADERRQVLWELQALERLMQVHGAPADAESIGSDASDGIRRWGTFQLREQIGAGRFGSVYRAWDPNLERDVAIKLLDVDGVDRAAYLREARHLARVRHANVVHVYGAAEFDEIPGFWMELVEGQTFAQVFQEHGPLGVEELSVVGDGMCRALTAIHRAGLLHQDVKAQNVMREPDGRLVLMDLGAGSGIGHGGRPHSGTPRYMAPELFDGGVASVQSDIYSLGVLLFLLAAGEFPMTGRTYDEIAMQHRERRGRALGVLRPGLPSGFRDAIDRVLSPDPMERFASAEEFSASMLSEVS
jgi:hypothetical protein